ncbi:Glutamyl-tRNA reductase [Clostridium liquoris]|jgi:glutamyl-tRNA reductase|uniref:Glutamyl-tRNA reductase n=1 Tax=Clostridium liquoris TaxID=1289519 RepID=A0A2T0B333_9CLOT|nr:glutamyl-tRNA reductase [Clostridium liquoris]PRR78282.1 Glutamyl-tRNA reductase [Clostridium liquoris]
MIGVLGVRSDVKLEIREKLSIIQKHYDNCLESLKEVCDEVLILSTCNRTEIYFNTCKDYEEIVLEIFDKLKWDKNYIRYTFYHEDEHMVNHLMKVICGFDSLILGEDQILGQIKDAYEIALNTKSIKKDLQKLFQMAITCGKEFRFQSKLYTIPVSSASIAVNEGRKKGARSFMVLGYGEIGSLACKYILSGSFDRLYIAVRNTSVVNIKDKRVKVIHFNERQNFYKYVDCIISCTSAPHIVVHAEELLQKPFIIYDLAVPRDVEESTGLMENVELYDIDRISCINDENCQKREEIMNSNKYILEKYTKEFLDWQKLKEISPEIRKLQKYGEQVYMKRYKTFKNKKYTKDNDELAETLLKSTSNAYINRAIEVLKEEQLKGRLDECLNIIQRIFYITE